MKMNRQRVTSFQQYFVNSGREMRIGRRTGKREREIENKKIFFWERGERSFICMDGEMLPFFLTPGWTEIDVWSD